MTETDLKIDRLVKALHFDDPSDRREYREELIDLVKIARMDFWLAVEQSWKQAEYCLKD